VAVGILLVALGVHTALSGILVGAIPIGNTLYSNSPKLYRWLRENLSLCPVSDTTTVNPYGIGGR
jgi:hypothetical protein